jgi:hypothetical protein
LRGVSHTSQTVASVAFVASEQLSHIHTAHSHTSAAMAVSAREYFGRRSGASRGEVLVTTQQARAHLLWRSSPTSSGCAATSSRAPTLRAMLQPRMHCFHQLPGPQGQRTPAWDHGPRHSVRRLCGTSSCNVRTSNNSRRTVWLHLPGESSDMRHSNDRRLWIETCTTQCGCAASSFVFLVVALEGSAFGARGRAHASKRQEP